jgi:hypothetical protein
MKSEILNKKEETSKLLRLIPAEAEVRTGSHLCCFEDCDKIHRRIADEMI